MFKFKSLLLVFLALLLTACQTSNTQQLEDKFATFERSALSALQQSLDSDLKFESVPTAVEDTDAPGVAVTSIADAQQLALLHSERVAGILLELGIHEATAVQKQLLENPGIGLSMMRPEDGGHWKMELSLSLGLVDWLSRQQRQALSASEIALWQLQAWQRLSDELTQVANQWLQAVAAQQKLQAHRELYESAVVAADFAQLLFDAGNISELELLGSQSIVTQRQAQQINAELDAAKKASMIKMSLGLSHETAIIIPDKLPMIDQTLLIAPALETRELLQLAQQHQPALLLTNRETQRSQLELATAVRRINLRQSGLELMSERESNGERVRVRIGNLSMWNHPIHMHGVQFEVTGSDGGRRPQTQWRKEVTEIVGVGQTRDLEFTAVPGDWPIHCHMSHHTMNAMGHSLPNTIGVNQRQIARRIAALVPGYMPMGEHGMSDRSPAAYRCRSHARP